MLLADTQGNRLGNARRFGRENAYRTRMLASLALSLLAVTILLRAPLQSSRIKIGWNPEILAEHLEVSVDRSVQAFRIGGAVVTSIGVPTPSPPAAPEATEGSREASQDPPESPVHPMQVRETVYEYVESPPEIRGGIGSYYIHIEYPPEAVQQLIEGRLVLRFVVGTNGRARDIVVTKSLHPLCDSAAVRALRETTFVPGRQNGKKVSVRMQLPVRFRLIGPGARPSEES